MTNETVSTTEDRQQSEQAFFDDLYKKGWARDSEQIDEASVPPNMLVYWKLVRDHLGELKSRNPDARVLDCGCGYGVLSVLVARFGLHVTAVDISPHSIAIVERLARANGVEERISALATGLEDLGFEEASFDCVLGTRILHHVDVETGGRHLARVLKIGGKAVFWECTERNVLLRFARKHLRRLLPLPKYGTTHEHPLTAGEVAALGELFGAPAQLVAAPFYFFNLADEYLFRQRFKPITRILQGLDTVIARLLPFMNYFSFHQVLVFERTRRNGDTDA